MKNDNALFTLLNAAPSVRGARVAAAVLAGFMAAMAPAASAGTIGISNGQLIVGTEPGDGNQSIIASIAGTDLVISGVNFDIVTPGCTGVGTVNCALSGVRELIVLGGDGDDAISLAAISAPAFTTLILGGAGDDVLVGSGGDDLIFGGPCDDVLIGGPGLDCLNAGPGGNVVIQAPTSCFNGPDPVVSALPRAVATPEPGGFWLLGAELTLLSIGMRRAGRRYVRGAAASVWRAAPAPNQFPVGIRSR